MTRPIPSPSQFIDVPPGHIAAVVTSLQMLAPPEPRPAPPFPAGVGLVPLRQPTPARYRSLFRAVGQDWLWFSRLVMPDAQLSGILHDPRVEIFALTDGDRDLGILELDFRAQGQCELAFFGVAPEGIGKGLGRTLMNVALDTAWSRPIERLWVHTCTLDHPGAVAFYRRSGFEVCGRQVEIAPDPRLTGALPRDSAPHVPLIEG